MQSKLVRFGLIEAHGPAASFPGRRECVLYPSAYSVVPAVQPMARPVTFWEQMTNILMSFELSF